MSSFSRSFLTVLFSVHCLLGCSDTSDNSAVDNGVFTEAETAAIEVIERHMVARNNRDADGLAAENNYTHSRIGTIPPVLSWDTPESFALHNELLVIPGLDAAGWGHSEWDYLEVSQSDGSKVHIEAQYSRFDLAGNVYKVTETFWIVTRQDDHWGVKFRSSFGADHDADEAAKAAAEAAALEVLEQHIQARNGRDSEQLAALNNYPHVILEGVVFNTLDSPENYIIYEETEVIPELDYSDWAESKWGVIDVVQSGGAKAHIVAELSLFNVLGEKFETTKSLWVVTKVGEHWGIQGRSSFVKDSQ